MTERTEQLAQANAEITTLNAQLQTENLRLGAELEVTRKLQQMLLADARGTAAGRGPGYSLLHGPSPRGRRRLLRRAASKRTVKIGIGDVTDHGLESGVVMLMTQAIVRTLLTSGESDPVRSSCAQPRYLGNVQRMETDRNLTLLARLRAGAGPAQRPARAAARPAAGGRRGNH